MPIVLDGTDSIGDLGDALNAKLNLAGGKVLQIVRATDTTQRTTTSTSYVDVTGMTITITPQKSNSAIILIAAISCEVTGSNTERRADLRLTNSSNNPVPGADEVRIGSSGLSAAGVAAECHSPTIMGVVLPESTTAVTYKLQFKAINSSNTLVVRNSSNVGIMYAIEVSA